MGQGWGKDDRERENIGPYGPHGAPGQFQDWKGRFRDFVQSHGQAQPMRPNTLPVRPAAAYKNGGKVISTSDGPFARSKKGK